MKILGVITARGGSKGIPGKNIKPLGGRPLIAYTAAVAKKSRLVNDLILSTDDKAIADVVKQLGVAVPFLRPKELAEDKTPHVPVMQHALDFMEKQQGYTYDYVVTLQPTSPFRTAEDIDRTIQKAIDLKADSAVSLVEVSRPHPSKFKKLEGDRVLPYFFDEPEGVRRQDLPKVYVRSGAVYVSKRDLLKNQGQLFGNLVVGLVVPEERSTDIDTEYDWMLTEYKYEKLNEAGFFKDFFG